MHFPPQADGTHSGPGLISRFTRGIFHSFSHLPLPGGVVYILYPIHLHFFTSSRAPWIGKLYSLCTWTSQRNILHFYQVDVHSGYAFTLTYNKSIRTEINHLFSCSHPLRLYPGSKTSWPPISPSKFLYFISVTSRIVIIFTVFPLYKHFTSPIYSVSCVRRISFPHIICPPSEVVLFSFQTG